MRNFSCFLLIILSFFLISSDSDSIGNDLDALNQIAKANDLYRNKKYSKATIIYKSLISSGYKNGYLFFNAGNAYFRQGKLGLAILHYQKALKKLPRNQNIDANLRYAVMKTTDKILETQKPLLKEIIFWVDDFSMREFTLFLVIINFIFWSTLFVKGLSKKKIWDNLLWLTGIILIWVLISTGAKIYIEINFKSGVIMSHHVEVKSAQGNENITLFELHEGAVVNLGDVSGDWVQLKIKDNEKGWAQKKEVNPI